MRDLIESIINKQYDSANELLESALYNITAMKLEESKKATSAKMSVEGSAFLGMPGSNSEKLERGVTEEDEQLDESRIKIHKARVRGGKVQRRKRVSNVEGYKLHDGKLKRMSPAERRRRKLGQKRGKLKRRSKLRMTLMKRKRSLRKRASIGL